jgi:hypothetical protein
LAEDEASEGKEDIADGMFNDEQEAKERQPIEKEEQETPKQAEEKEGNVIVAVGAPPVLLERLTEVPNEGSLMADSIFTNEENDDDGFIVCTARKLCN